MSDPTPIVRFLGRAWVWLRENDRPLIVCFAFVAGLYALFEYWDHEKTDREREVTNFVHRQGTVDYARARTRLDVFMMTPEVNALRKDTYDGFISAKMNDSRIMDAIFVELSFFDSLSICVESGRCSKEISCRYFFSDAQGFLQNFRPILKRLEVRSNEGSMVRLTRFAHSHCKSHMPTYCRTVQFRSDDCIRFRPPKYT